MNSCVEISSLSVIFNGGFGNVGPFLLSIMKGDGGWGLRMKGEISCNVWDTPWNEELNCPISGVTEMSCWEFMWVKKRTCLS